MTIWSIWKSVYFGGFFGDDPNEEAQENYKFYIDVILHFQKLFDYSVAPQDILNLPYCLFQDLILARVEERKKEIEKQKEELEKVKSGRKFIVKKR